MITKEFKFKEEIAAAPLKDRERKIGKFLLHSRHRSLFKKKKLNKDKNTLLLFGIPKLRITVEA